QAARAPRGLPGCTERRPARAAGPAGAGSAAGAAGAARTGSSLMSERLRIFATGSCEGLDEILQVLAIHDGIELIGSSENVTDAAGPLSGGHLDVVLHAT